MKILLVAHSFPRHEGDMAGAFLLSLARRQIARGHTVAVVAPHAAGLRLRETLAGVDVRRYRYGRDAHETLAYAGTMHEQVLRSWRARGRLLRFLTASRRATAAAIRELQPDVVHVHWWFPGAFALWPHWRRRPPMVLTSHGTDLFLLDKIPAARALAGPIFRAAAQVTVISTPLVPRVTALGVAADRVTVVPMPVDESLGAEQGRARDPRELLFVGRLVERKGAEFAVRALAELRGRGEDVRLTVAGDGPERGALESLARELGLGASVEFLGVLPTPDVHRLYARAAIFVMPAVTDWKGEQEGFGLVVVEAMRAGMPVVASRSGGIPDILRDGETGFLVPERDITALADRLQLLLGDAALAGRVGAAAAADARSRFGPERIADTFDRVYARAVEAR